MGNGQSKLGNGSGNCSVSVGASLKNSLTLFLDSKSENLLDLDLMYLQKILQLYFMQVAVISLNRNMHLLHFADVLLIMCIMAWLSHQIETLLFLRCLAQIKIAMHDPIRSATSIEHPD